MPPIRPATPADVPHVLGMVRRMAEMHEQLDPQRYGLGGDPAPLYEPWLIRRAADPRSVFLVAQRPAPCPPDAGPLVAYLIATIMEELPMYRLRQYGFVHDLWVEEDYRHEGLGRQMTMLALERFAQLGIAQVRLHVAAGNQPARRLYEACGFYVDAVEMLVATPPGGAS